MSPGRLDEGLFWMVNGHYSAPADYLMAAFTYSALTIPAVVIALVAMYFYKGLAARNIWLLAVSLVVAGVALHGMKYVTGADRPLAYFAKTKPPRDQFVHAPFERHEAGSFPSGHSQTAFSVATFMALMFRRHRPLWFAWAALVAFSRVYLGVHFPIDIAAGAITGVAATLFAVITATVLRPPAPGR
ncbi:MAG: phosphatase PAP2 family protein [Nitrospinae bacterium]|nr:phosphatase PAP2 family protein [Nitrospinota bacterium]